MPTESSRSVTTTLVSGGSGGSAVGGAPSSCPTIPPPSGIGPVCAGPSMPPAPASGTPACSPEEEEPHEVATAIRISDENNDSVRTTGMRRCMRSSVVRDSLQSTARLRWLRKLNASARSSDVGARYPQGGACTSSEVKGWAGGGGNRNPPLINAGGGPGAAR